MKHIGILINDLSLAGGGADLMAISLAKELLDRGYNVSIISLHFFEKPFFEVDKRVKIYHLQKNTNDESIVFSGNILSRLKTHYTIFNRLNKIIKNNQIDILISNGVQIAPIWVPVKFWNKRLKVISWEHMNATLQWPSFVKGRKLARKYADAIVVLTQQDKELYQEEGASNAPIFVRNNFMSKYPDDKALLISKNVLAVGRYSEQKGFDILIDIWEKVKQHPIAKDWILRIVGDGEERENLNKLITEKELEESLILTGPTHNVAQYYLDSSIYVMTSRNEGLPVVLIEAQSYGLPLVSFDCATGPREIIIDGTDGFLIPMGNTEEMEKKILELMANEKLRISMGKNAKENSQRFKKEHIIEQWAELIEKLK